MVGCQLQSSLSIVDQTDAARVRCPPRATVDQPAQVVYHGSCLILAFPGSNPARSRPCPGTTPSRFSQLCVVAGAARDGGRAEVAPVDGFLDSLHLSRRGAPPLPQAAFERREKNLKGFKDFDRKSQDLNLAVSVLHVPYSRDSGCKAGGRVMPAQWSDISLSSLSQVLNPTCEIRNPKP